MTWVSPFARPDFRPVKDTRPVDSDPSAQSGPIVSGILHSLVWRSGDVCDGEAAATSQAKPDRGESLRRRQPVPERANVHAQRVRHFAEGDRKVQRVHTVVEGVE